LTDALSTIGLLANFGSIQKLTLEALTKAGASSADILEFKNKMELTLKTVFDGDDTVHLLLTTVLESTLEDGSTLDPLLAVKKALEKDKDASSALEGLGFVLEQLDPKSKSTEMQIMYANLYQLSKFYVQSHPGDPTF
jgi:hypothetical protein